MPAQERGRFFRRRRVDADSCSQLETGTRGRPRNYLNMPKTMPVLAKRRGLKNVIEVGMVQLFRYSFQNDPKNDGKVLNLWF